MANDIKQTNKHTLMYKKKNHLKEITSKNKNMASNPENLENLQRPKSLKVFQAVTSANCS